MIALTGFADEIAPDLGAQIETLRSEGMKYLELRGIWGANVLDLTKDQRKEAKARLADAGIGVSAIGSPIGKVEIDKPWPEHVERFKVAMDAAECFDAPYIRIFSYYPPAGGRIADHRDEVLRRLREQMEMAKGRRFKLLHENEAAIYGEKTPECLDIARSVSGLKAIFDPANFVCAGLRPASAWTVLRDYVVYFHIKDAMLADKTIRVAGEGDGDIEAILRDAILARGFDGFLSLEPHLAAAGQFAGFSGPNLFKKAVQGLKKILRKLDVKFQ